MAVGNSFVYPSAGYSKKIKSLDELQNGAQIALAIIINTYASQINLTPTKDGLFVEEKDSPYVNLIVSREDNKDAANVKKFVQDY